MELTGKMIHEAYSLLLDSGAKPWSAIEGNKPLVNRYETMAEILNAQMHPDQRIYTLRYNAETPDERHYAPTPETLVKAIKKFAPEVDYFYIIIEDMSNKERGRAQLYHRINKDTFLEEIEADGAAIGLCALLVEEEKKERLEKEKQRHEPHMQVYYCPICQTRTERQEGDGITHDPEILSCSKCKALLIAEPEAE